MATAISLFVSLDYDMGPVWEKAKSPSFLSEVDLHFPLDQTIHEIGPLVTYRFTQMNAAVSALSRVLPGFSVHSVPAGAGLEMDTLLLGLELAESVSKSIPAVGSLIEGACGTMRRILSAAEVCLSSLLSSLMRKLTLTIQASSCLPE